VFCSVFCSTNPTNIDQTLKSLPEHPQPPQPTYVNMTELASMAASKITNQQQQQQQPICQQVQLPQQPQTMPSIQQLQHHQHSQPQYQQLIQVNPNSPVLSSTSSLISPDSASATNPITSSISSPDGVSSSACSSQTPQNVSPDGDAVTPIGGGDSDGGGFATPIILSPKNHAATIIGVDGTDYHTVAPKSKTNDLTTNNSPPDNLQDTTNKTIHPPETDIISSGSVLAKTSLFEKLEQQQQQAGGNASLTATPTNQAKTPVECIYAGANNVASKKSVAQQQEEIYKSSGDSGKCLWILTFKHDLFFGKSL
jgi:metastasis suppressor protein 1